MNRTKIEWTNYSWNPITGCLHDCWYCYAKKLFTRFHKSFDPTFHPDRLYDPWKLKKPSKIFCCSVSDLFAPWTPREWMYSILDKISACPINHAFQVLTKNPEGIPDRLSACWVGLKKLWVGVTVSTQEETWRIDELRKVDAELKFVSFEPLLGSICPDLRGINWVIIGKLTGSSKVKLDYAWVAGIMVQASRLAIPVFQKTNLGLKNPTQEFPRY